MTTATHTRGTPAVEIVGPRLRVWLLGFAGFAVLARVVLAVPVGDLGWRILLLVVVFHLGAVLLARRTGDEYLWRAWTVLAPLSVVMVLPDWFLSAVLGSLEFPDTGGPFIGTVPVFMAGMWTIALLPIVLVGALASQKAGRGSDNGAARRNASHGATNPTTPSDIRDTDTSGAHIGNRSLLVGVAAAAVAGLVFFWAAELIAPSIPIWQPVDVSMFAGVAVYVLLPEAVLSAAAYVLVATVGRVPRAATAAMVLLLPFTYTGMLATSYQFLG